MENSSSFGWIPRLVGVEAEGVAMRLLAGVDGFRITGDAKLKEYWIEYLVLMLHPMNLPMMVHRKEVRTVDFR